jgi:hypothetical protein
MQQETHLLAANITAFCLWLPSLCTELRLFTSAYPAHIMPRLHTSRVSCTAAWHHYRCPVAAAITIAAAATSHERSLPYAVLVSIKHKALVAQQQHIVCCATLLPLCRTPQWCIKLHFELPTRAKPALYAALLASACYNTRILEYTDVCLLFEEAAADC